jgi:hypothetical protein
VSSSAEVLLAAGADDPFEDALADAAAGRTRHSGFAAGTGPVARAIAVRCRSGDVVAAGLAERLAPS